MKKFLGKLKNVKPADFFHLLLFVFALLPAKILKKRRPAIWLFCEYGQEARDNAYWQFRYTVEEHPEVDAVYAIDPKSADHQRVAVLGQTIPYGTFRHWIYYLAAEVNISTQKGGKPNAAACYLLEVYGILKNKRVFLQHGITKDLAELFFYQNTRMRLFICGAKPEYDFVKKEFGYPEGYVAYTGFSRFDALHREVKRERYLLVCPTWRSWLYTNSSDPYDNSFEGIRETEYYRRWMGVLMSEKLHDLLRAYGYRVKFFPHRNMTACFENTEVDSELIEVTNWKTCDLQVLMKETSCLLTDYSSVAMDVAYMEKPVLYYQFDYEKYRAEQFTRGYFSYERDGFGPVCEEETQLLSALEDVLKAGCRVAPAYKERIGQFFELRDAHNCQRIFEEICKL